MPTQYNIGEILKQRRMQMRLSIDDIARTTKLQPRSIEAFEEMNFKSMPPMGYARAMLGTYAHSLELDPEQVVKLFEEQWEDWDKQNKSGQQDSQAQTGSSLPYSSYSGNRQSYLTRADSLYDDYPISERPSADSSTRSFQPAVTSRGSSTSAPARSGKKYAWQTRAHEPAGNQGANANTSWTSDLSGSNIFNNTQRSSKRAVVSAQTDEPRIRNVERKTVDTRDMDDYAPQGSERDSGSTAIKKSSFQRSAGVAFSSTQETLQDVLHRVLGYLNEHKLVFISVLAAVVMIILVLSFAACSSSCSNTGGGSTSIPVTSEEPTPSGQEDVGAPTTSTDNAQATQVSTINLSALPPGSYIDLHVRSDAAVNPWLEIMIDGIQVAGWNASPDYGNRWFVNSSARIITSAPDVVDVAVNGSFVYFTLSGSSGVLQLTVDPYLPPL